MQVKQRLKINLILSTTTVLIVFLILALALYRINKANNIAKIAQDIILNAFERVTLRNDYLQNNNERAKAQWFARHEAIGRVLESESKSFQPAEDKKTIDELFKNHESIEKIFSAIVENRGKKKTASDDTDISQEVEDRLLNQLNIKVYEEVLHGRELLASSREARSSATRLAGTWIACVLVILIAAVIINSGFMDRTITDRVRVLRDGALMIGGGNLDHRIDVKGDDEFAELSGAFNAMTINLQTSYLELKKEIAERKRVEEAFRESEERLRLAVEAADLGTFDLDITSGIAVHSPRHDQIFGYREPVPEWTYEIAIKHVLPEDLPLVLEAHASAEKTGVFGYEGRVVWSDGSIHWIAPRGTVHYDSDGRPVRLIGVIADITDLKRAEEVLRKAYDDLEIRVQERTKELNELNETLEQRVTERTAELQTANASLFNSRRAALNLMEDALAARRRAEEASDELRREVIERRRAEEALRQSREDLDRAQEVGQIGWWRLDTQQNVLTWSDENHRIFGIPKGTAMSYETFQSAVHPDDREYVDTQWQDGLQGKPYDIEHRLVVGGKTKWVREKAYLEFGKDGSLLGGFGITQDITEKKLAEEELRRTKEGLEVRIAERTAALRYANRKLEDEISERIDIENNLKTTNALLKLFSKTFSRQEYLDALVAQFREWCGCDGVGIRLTTESGNFPYVAASGFSQEFIEQEGSIIVGKDSCVCTRIAQEQPDKAEASLITSAGSFVCNDSSCLRNAEKNGESATYRGACLQQGFTSLAVVPIRYRDEIKGVIHLADRKADRFSEQVISLAESLTPLIGEALQRFDVEAALTASREQLRSLSSHLLAAREQERLRVAREIHDDLGQTLTAASMELGMLKKAITKPNSVTERIKMATELIDAAIEDIQRICSELRPRVLDHLGLRAAIEWQAKKFADRSGISCLLDLPHERITLSPAAETALFRIFQEALTNVARHAKATRASVRLAVEDNGLTLEITDDGKGIAIDRISGEDAFGIMGMKERARELGGEVTFKGVRNKGTTVTVKVPLEGRRTDV